MSYGKRTLAAIGQRLNASRRLVGRNLVLALSPLGAGRHPGPQRVGEWRGLATRTQEPLRERAGGPPEYGAWARNPKPL